jgi:hypothetical protein
MYRKLIAAIFIFALLFNAVGAYMVLESMKYSVRKEIKKKIKRSIPGSELHVLQFAISDLEAGTSQIHWIHTGEFRYKGKMYDIVRRSVQHGYLILHCINDTDEERLFAGIDALVNDLSCKDPKASHKSRIVIHLLTQVMFQEIPTFKFSTDRMTMLEFGYTKWTMDIYADVPSPPPKTNA